MSRKMLITLIVIMILVLSGLIIVQTKMIKTAFDIREEQFNTLIKNALASVAYRLNQYEENDARRSAMLNRLPRAKSPVGNLFPRSSGEGGSVQFGLRYSNDGGISSYEESFQLNFQDTIDLSDDDTLADDVSGINELLQLGMDQKNQREQFLNDMEWSNYKFYLEERPIKERIDSLYLNNVLAEAIKETGVGLDYKYAVKNANLGKEKIILGSSDYKPGSKIQYSQILFPNDYNPKPNYLYLYFPKRSGFLLHETGTTIIPTIILTAFLIGIFVYTIMIILKQKKLSSIKNDFINNMTHELKTPISTISLASQMLQDGTISNTPQTISHISGVINQESKRLSFQVEKVLQMAVFNEGRLKLEI